MIEDEIKQNEYIIGNVLKNLSFKNILEKYYEDLYQIGRIALWKAIETKDDTKGNFYSYAYTVIKNAILDEYKSKIRYKNRIEFEKTAEFDNEESNYFINYNRSCREEFLVIDFKSFEKNLTAEELKIYKKKLNGKTNEAIGKELNINRIEVGKKIKVIKEKFKDNVLQ